MQEHAFSLQREPSGTRSAPEGLYQERCRQFAQQRERYHHWSNWNANLNVVLALASLACLGLWLWRGGWMVLIATVFLALAFVAAYIHLGRLDALEQRYHTLWQINDEGLRRLRRDWAHLPLRQPADPALQHPYAGDLDLLGHASLQHLLGTPNTPVGQMTLQNWLLHPAAPEEIIMRQQAVAELAPQVQLRDDLALIGRQMGKAQLEYEQFLAWAEGEPWLARRRWLLWLARLLALTTLVLIGVQISGLMAYPFWLTPLAINLALSGTLGRQAATIIDEIEEKHPVFRTYADLFQLITSQRFTTPALQALQQQLSADGLSADQQMRRLARLMPLATIRRAMFFIIVQWLILWDFHILWLFERWQRVAGQSARAWLEALGAIEALAALATLAHDHPDWAFPQVDTELPAGHTTVVFDAVGLGHPLLPPAVCVRSNVSIGPPGTFLLVTGSNMSGKSTLLRSIGGNIVLAQAGGPVCASSLRLVPIVLATTIRVQDSLEQGISYFMAELKRIKAVVDVAEQAHTEGKRIPLFLLDEILHGTNTGERQIAVQHILRHLLDLGATGAVSTHDLNLADAPGLATTSHPVHFAETFIQGPEGLEMRFDYQLRPGLATSTNALKLLKMVGLPTGTASAEPADLV